MGAKYCRCKNTFCISCCDMIDCKYPDYWKFGIGSTTAATTHALFQNEAKILFENGDNLEFN